MSTIYKIMGNSGIDEKKFGLYVGRTVCHRAKKRIIKEFLGD